MRKNKLRTLSHFELDAVVGGGVGMGKSLYDQPTSTIPANTKEAASIEIPN
jgi:hypothetical protein